MRLPAAISGRYWAFAAEGVDRVHAQRGLHRHEAAQGRIAALELLADQTGGHRIQARASIALQTAAQQPEFGHFRNQLAWKAVILKALADDRQNARINEARNAILNGLLFRA